MSSSCWSDELSVDFYPKVFERDLVHCILILDSVRCSLTGFTQKYFSLFTRYTEFWICYILYFKNTKEKKYSVLFEFLETCLQYKYAEKPKEWISCNAFAVAMIQRQKKTTNWMLVKMLFWNLVCYWETVGATGSKELINDAPSYCLWHKMSDRMLKRYCTSVHAGVKK